MAVIRKPKAQTHAVDVEALIAKGGSVPSAPPPAAAAATPKAVLLHVPAALLAHVDQAIHTQTIKIPRKTWILQAIQEKLARDSGTN